MLKINGSDGSITTGPKDRTESGPISKDQQEEFQQLYNRPEDEEPGEGRKGGTAGNETRSGRTPVENVSSIYSSLLRGTEAAVSTTDPGSAEKDKLEEFQRRPSPLGDEEPGVGRKRGAAENEARGAPVESLSSIYSSLLSGTGGSAPSMATAAGPVEPAGNLNELVNGLVSQILASPVEQGGDREVRIMVNADLLPDTEIRLSRSPDGLLSVTLISGRPESFQTLVASQDSLRTALSGLENNEVRLTVSGSGAEDGSADRRSRGHGLIEPGDE
jgi:type III secretion system needle length determinant